MAINGKRPENLFNWTMPECNENERILYDIESGHPYKVTLEHYNSYMKMLEDIRPKWNENIGVVFITGTGGSMNGKDDIKDMFYNPTQWKLGNENLEKD